MENGLFGEHVFPAVRLNWQVFAITLLTTASAAPQVPAVEPPPGDFADLSLEQLGNIELKSA